MNNSPIKLENRREASIATPFSRINSLLEKKDFIESIKNSLLPSMSSETFLRSARSLFLSNPSNFITNINDIPRVVISAANDGLLLDNKESTALLFWDKALGRLRLSYMPMAHGIKKIITRGGHYVDLRAVIIKENDFFDYEEGDNPYIRHKPLLVNQGDPIGAYAIAKDKNGNIYRNVCSIDYINKVRDESRSKKAKAENKEKDGPWVTWWEEMAKKTCIRQLFKTLPLDGCFDRDMFSELDIEKEEDTKTVKEDISEYILGKKEEEKEVDYIDVEQCVDLEEENGSLNI